MRTKPGEKGSGEGESHMGEDGIILSSADGLSSNDSVSDDS